MSTRGAVRNVRQRKLNTRQGLRIIREDQIDDATEDESQRQFTQVETGVEKGEEIVSTSPPIPPPILLTKT
jgi:enhancer of polycomb-like protein